ncbi:MAG: LysR family transcriptional regulator [Firmicutes bacterium]|nr:LysR family transcriptional regulator [Bacillota bacterium]
MELRQLRYFLALAQHLHFARAAESLHIAQPSLSQQIRALEDELGVTLFERSKRHVALTADGEALLPYARQMVALAEDARAELAERGRLRRGRVRLGTTPTLGGHLLPRLISGFFELYPGLELTITEDGSDRLARGLEEGRLDLALLVEEPHGSVIGLEPLFEEPIVAVLPGGHPLAGQEAIRLEDLRHDGFILCREGYHLRSLTLDACRRAGFTPRVAVSGTDVDTALRFVQSGLGVALVPEMAAADWPGVCRAVLRDPPLFRTIALAWNSRRYLSRAAAALQEYLRRNLPSASDGWGKPRDLDRIQEDIPGRGAAQTGSTRLSTGSLMPKAPSSCCGTQHD